MRPEWERAASAGDATALAAQIEGGAEIDALDRFGQSALMIAARHGHLAAVEVLIRAGAALDVTAKFGLSATMLAVVNHHEDVARALAAAGSDLTLVGTGAPGFAGKTAAQLALDRNLEALASALAVGSRNGPTGESVIVVAYDPRWPREFEAERDRIASRLGGLALRIDHNGSTAVPGLAAKPVIDIQISVERLHPIEAYAPLLAGLGYRHLPHPDDAFGPFFHRPEHWPHTHHIHVVQAGGEEERRTLAFRDCLREDAALAREYEALKRKLARRLEAGELASREDYAEAKGDFVRRVTELALARGHPRELRARS